MEMLNNWNEERKERLQTLYRDGLSFTLIAAKIGVSRNAAIGKAHRLKLPRRAVAKAPPRKRQYKYKYRDRHKVNAVIKEEIKIDPARDYRCDILGLNDATCRYPMWRINAPPHERLYCGVPSASLIDGIPYCEHHTRLTLQNH